MFNHMSGIPFNVLFVLIVQGDVVTMHKTPSKWKKIKVLTDNRRRAVIQCFMSVPYFKLPL